jgi:hypothetical protein
MLVCGLVTQEPDSPLALPIPLRHDIAAADTKQCRFYLGRNSFGQVTLPLSRRSGVRPPLFNISRYNTGL